MAVVMNGDDHGIKEVGKKWKIQVVVEIIQEEDRIWEVGKK